MQARGRVLATCAFGGLMTISVALAESPPILKLNTTLEGDSRPLLCKDPDTVNLVVSVVDRAIAARSSGDVDKAKRLFEIAAKLESEICIKSAPDDVVILRCNLGQKQLSGTQIALIKLSALLRDNSSAGEQPFYGWTYADILPGADDTTAQEASKRWCSDEQQQASADQPLDPTPDLVQRIQQRFYDFGFNVPSIDGRLNQETIQSLVAFQKWAGLQPSGQFTKLTVEKIDATPAPSSWVAIAFDGWGNNNIVTGDTRRVAEADAVSGLRRRSRSNYSVTAVPYPNCIALSATRYGGRRRTFTQAFTSSGDSENGASQNALDYCEREKGGGTCRVRNVLCAPGAGQAQRYDPSNIPANSPAPGAGRFEPGNEPLNAQAPGVGAALRFDPSNIPANSPAPDSANAPQGSDAQGQDSGNTDNQDKSGGPSDDKSSGSGGGSPARNP